MSKNLQLFAGIISIILVPVWMFQLTPELLKLPPNISSKANMVHTENNRFSINSQWTGKTIAISSSRLNTFSTVKDKSTIQSVFRVESLTGEKLFELNQNFVIDRLTRHNLPGGNDPKGDSSILFGINVNQKSINFWPVEMGAPTTLQYTGDKVIQGINTKHFNATGAIIDDTLGFEYLPLVPEKYKVLSRVDIDIYVEPSTGTIIDYQDTGISYFADKENKPIWDMDDWSNKYNDPTIIERVRLAKSKMLSYNIISIYTPAFFASLGLLLILVGIVNKDKKIAKKK